MPRHERLPSGMPKPRHLWHLAAPQVVSQLACRQPPHLTTAPHDPSAPSRPPRPPALRPSLPPTFSTTPSLAHSALTSVSRSTARVVGRWVGGEGGGHYMQGGGGEVHVCGERGAGGRDIGSGALRLPLRAGARPALHGRTPRTPCCVCVWPRLRVAIMHHAIIVGSSGGSWLAMVAPVPAPTSGPYHYRCARAPPIRPPLRQSPRHDANDTYKQDIQDRPPPRMQDRPPHLPPARPPGIRRA